MFNTSKKYVYMAIVILVVISVFTVFILLTSDTQLEPVDVESKPTVGFLADNLVVERWLTDQEIFVAKAMEAGLDVIVYNANESNATQVKQIYDLIEKKVDVIVVIPYDKDGLTEAIGVARKAGIKVISYDRLVMNADIDAYVSFDNVKIGRYQSEMILDIAEKGEFILINGSPDDNNSDMFREGCLVGLSDALTTGEVTLGDEIWADNWREEFAYDGIVQLIKKNESFEAIIAANDRLAEAAIKALTEYGLAGTVPVVGNDAEISACQRIVEGTQYGTVYKPIRELAENAVRLTLKLINNEPITSEEFIDNGYKSVPHIKLDVYKVTIDTLDETVIKDGFHRAEDVYR